MCAFLSNLFNIPTEPKATEFRDPIFIIGLMRSGTTLLMNTLSEHPQLLKAGFELNDIWNNIGGAPCSVNCAERTEEDFSVEYANNMTAYFTSYIEKSKSFMRHLARWSAKKHYGSGAIRYDWDDLYLMNKSPHLSNKIRYINKMYPKAKFIVIVRDIYGQSASLKMHFENHHKKENYYFELPDDASYCWTNHLNPDVKKLKTSNIYPGNFGLIPKSWIRLNRLIFNHLETVPKANKLVLTYESLVTNQENELSKVFGFLNLNKKHQAIQKSICKKSRTVSNTTTKGDPLKKWKKYLEPNEISDIDKMIKSDKLDFDYICSNLKIQSNDQD